MRGICRRIALVLAIALVTGALTAGGANAASPGSTYAIGSVVIKSFGPIRRFEAVKKPGESVLGGSAGYIVVAKLKRWKHWADSNAQAKTKCLQICDPPGSCKTKTRARSSSPTSGSRPDARAPSELSHRSGVRLGRVTSTADTAPVAERASPRPELVESKLRPPQTPASTVIRADLIDRLQRPRAAPIVSVTGPPGYGKTTLLTQWAGRARVPFAWVTLDDHDNDPVVMLGYIASALDRLSPLDPAVFDALASAETSIEVTVVPRLGAAMAAAEPFALVLDDLHLLTAQTCLDTIGMLIEHVPEGSRMALAGRGEPPARVAALRARGVVAEIGPDHLRMDQREAAELIRGTEARFEDAQVARLVELTEGWPAGLYLASLAGTSNIEDATPFRGDDRFVAEYLRSEVLSGLPQDELRFLTRTSVLDRMSGALCDAVLESEGSAEMLEAQHRSNRFVAALDRNRGWYRYHHLFRDLLRAELERAEPELAAELLLRGSEWCASNAEQVAAVAYAQAAGDVDRVAGLVIAYSRAQYEQGRALTVERWMEWLERHGGLDRNPTVAVMGAWLSAIRGHPSEAERWADLAERALLDNRPSEGDAFVEAMLATLRASECRHGPERMRTDAQLAADRFGRADPFWPTAALLLGLAHRLRGDHDRAGDLFDDAAESGRATQGWNVVTLALAKRASLAADTGEWGEAEALADEAIAVVRRARMEDYPPNTIVYAEAARVAIHRGETGRAEELLARAQPLRPRLTRAMGAFSIHTRLELARAYASLADAAGARTLLREVETLMRRGSDFGTLATDAEDLRLKLESVRVRTPGASTLTAAELRVLPLLTTHLSFREIGERLYISRHTVKSHAMSIYRKLDVRSRADAVKRARELGLLSG